MGFYGRITAAFFVGIVLLKLAAMLTPRPAVTQMWVGTGCPGGKEIRVPDLEDRQLRLCKESKLVKVKP